ncbi:MAG: hypothetical protein CO094_03820 [Anaerolineae bacterium CG_4_9_14_3_um_filter_57_17]|nr:hypothetical protein [bacterium]NCT20162.1 hypothetical protein [bacterium]OIO86883.1 MAG: hypothetical protein AUK01_01590 [Anaerolineae bacterium CG2_30_57_67]PJB67481.1 MAG: hypothetical protein CO094_03820 [Anaerolineae bacterium CG_4_9_14_3_um_filter_57_17]
MFDDLRKESEASPYFTPPAAEEEPVAEAAPPPPTTRRQVKINLAPGGKILGMTAPQRLILSVLLLMMVCVSGLMVLLLAGKIVLL